VVFGVTKLNQPKDFFDSNPKKLEEICFLVNSAFERDLDFEDIYNHITSPESVYLLEINKRLSAMASYNRKIFSGISCLVVEGIAVAPENQGKGIFSYMTDIACNNESVICLRTQNPRMYRALEKYCSRVYPNSGELPKAISAIKNELAEYLGCQLNDKGIILGYYGGLFYGKEPKHKEVSGFFKELGMELNKGDALVAIGVK